jgi:hypothetical protein
MKLSVGLAAQRQALTYLFATVVFVVAFHMLQRSGIPNFGIFT